MDAYGGWQYRGNTGLEVTVCEWFWFNSQDCVEWDDELHVCLRLAASCVSTTMQGLQEGGDDTVKEEDK